ncbi:transcription factor TFIIIB component B'' homolog isoform X2 [Physella acuta]|uniref:transcription factor TFIIIB component B'' homolog isoform X2 n=1 Tax=Physella acuta TaxID=109671 RepID=UPI0027DAD21A|nr:transcription factor TFIIIB component B'' homolog isoform X2 [Physella acuta]
MSTATTLTPSNYDQSKPETTSKSVSRRPRFVVKPNIRPGPSKATAPAKTKPITAEATTPSSKSQAANEDIVQTSLDQTDNNTDNTKSSQEILKESASKNDVSSLEKVKTNQDVTVSDFDSSLEKTRPEEENNLEISVTKTSVVKDEQPSILGQGGDSVSDGDAEPTQTLKEINPKLEQIKGKEESKGSTEPSLSEVDVSCMSDALSLEADEERQADADDDVKRVRRKKTKKVRTEPLPSREKSPDRQKMKMSDLLCWNPQQNFLQRKNKKKSTTNVSTNSPVAAAAPISVEDKEESNQSVSLPAPQIMIGPDGNVVLNTESLMIQTVQEDHTPREVIEEDDEDRYLNTNTYRKHKQTKFWTEGETERFFIGLSMCGTDFSLLTNLMTNRSRRELKNKFQREERRNRPLVDKALANRQRYDPSVLEKLLSEEEERLKRLVKKKAKKMTEKKQRQKRKGRKRKKVDSEDEEDDMGPEYDENEEQEEASKVPAKKSKSNRDKDSNVLFVLQSPDRGFPPYGSETPNTNRSISIGRTDSQGEAAFSTKQPQSSNIIDSTAFTNIQSIPGSTQVQIEMEGVSTPVQGVLIPSTMVPIIGPHLGIPDNLGSIQILLVQEDSASGNLVHVYVIPESDKETNPVPTSAAPGPGGLSVLNSPIPSPHPQSPLPKSHHPQTNGHTGYNALKSPPEPRNPHFVVPSSNSTDLHLSTNQLTTEQRCQTTASSPQIASHTGNTSETWTSITCTAMYDTTERVLPVGQHTTSSNSHSVVFSPPFASTSVVHTQAANFASQAQSNDSHNNAQETFLEDDNCVIIVENSDCTNRKATFINL